MASTPRQVSDSSTHIFLGNVWRCFWPVDWLCSCAQGKSRRCDSTVSAKVVNYYHLWIKGQDECCKRADRFNISLDSDQWWFSWAGNAVFPLFESIRNNRSQVKQIASMDIDFFHAFKWMKPGVANLKLFGFFTCLIFNRKLAATLTWNRKRLCFIIEEKCT